jgi:uncharacterized protein YbjT (DUF2867 family)
MTDQPVILVFGATGTVGSALCTALASSSHPYHIRALTRNTQSAAALTLVQLNPRIIHTVTVDHTSDECIRQTMVNVKRIFFLSRPFAQADVAVISRWLTLAKHQLDFVLYLSAINADAIGYGEVHRQIEAVVRNSGISYSLLRPITFMDNFVTPGVRQIVGINNDKFVGFSGDNRYAAVDVRDIGECAAKILSAPQADIGQYAGHAYDLTGSQLLSAPALAALLSQHLNRSIAYVHMTEEEYKTWLLTERNLPEAYAKAIIAGRRSLNEGKSSLVASGAQEILGRPARSWKQFLEYHGPTLRAALQEETQTDERKQEE